MAKILKSPTARAQWRGVLDEVKEADVVIERYGSPVAAIIPFEDYEQIREQLENLRAVRQAKSAYAEVTNGRAAGEAHETQASPASRGKSRSAGKTAPVQAATAIALEDINAKLQALQVEVAALRRQVSVDA